MNDSDGAKIVELLAEIRDHQAQALEIARRQAERTDRIQDRAEQLQERSAGIMRTARITIAIVLPVVIVAILYLSWLLFR